MVEIWRTAALCRNLPLSHLSVLLIIWLYDIDSFEIDTTTCNTMLFPRCSTNRWLKVHTVWFWKITAVDLHCIGINRMGERSKGWDMHQNTTSLSYILVFDVGTQVRKAGGCIVTSHHTLMVLFIILGQTLDQGHLQTVPTFRTSNVQTSHTYEWPSITKVVDIVLLPQANKANEATHYFHEILIYNLFSSLFNGSWK